MFSSKTYWEERYKSGGNSGVGSYSKFAEFKAEFVNAIIEKYSVRSVTEIGVGDGNQLSTLKVKKYIGIDVSETAIERCKNVFKDDKSKSFYLSKDFVQHEKSDMSLSMDVIYHLVEDDIFDGYMHDIFDTSSKLICIYASNTKSPLGEKNTKHVKHRRFTDWIEKNKPDSRLVCFKKNRYPYNGDYKTTSFSDFYVFTAK